MERNFPSESFLFKLKLQIIIMAFDPYLTEFKFSCTDSLDSFEMFPEHPILQERGGQPAVVV